MTTTYADSTTPGTHTIRPGAFGNATHLRCRACGASSPLGPYYACLECFGPLEVGYDFPEHHPRADRGRSAQHLALRAAAAGAGRHRDLPLHRPRLHPAGRRADTSPTTSA